MIVSPRQGHLWRTPQAGGSCFQATPVFLCPALRCATHTLTMLTYSAVSESFHPQQGVRAETSVLGSKLKSSQAGGPHDPISSH